MHDSNGKDVIDPEDLVVAFGRLARLWITGSEHRSRQADTSTMITTGLQRHFNSSGKDVVLLGTVRSKVTKRFMAACAAVSVRPSS